MGASSDSFSTSNDNIDADNDHDYDDDMLITGVKIIIIITAVGSQMYNSPRCNYVCALAGEKIHFRSTWQPCLTVLDPGEMSAPSLFPPVSDKEAVYKSVCSKQLRCHVWIINRSTPLSNWAEKHYY